MYRIVYSLASEQLIDVFIDSYKRGYERMYTDTGIEDEFLLRKTFVVLADSMRKDIRIKISYKLSGDEVYGYKIGKNDQTSIKVFLKSFILEIFYEENQKEKIRYIENMSIHKK